MGRIHPSSVGDGLRFEQHDPSLFLCTRFVFHSSGHHNHVSLPHAFRSVAEVHGLIPFEDVKKFVFVVVGVPRISGQIFISRVVRCTPLSLLF